MPEMDGYELTLQIRLAEARRARIPIIALTANALQGESERCRSVGMDHYLTKPASLAALSEALTCWLPDTGELVADTPEPSYATHGETAGPAESASAAGGEASAASEAAAVDLKVLAALVGDDPQLIAEFVRDFSGSAARSADDLIAAAEGGHSRDAAEIAHKLKSSARTMGALKLGDLCEGLEDAGLDGNASALMELLAKFRTEMTAVQQALGSATADDPLARRA